MAIKRDRLSSPRSIRFFSSTWQISKPNTVFDMCSFAYSAFLILEYDSGQYNCFKKKKLKYYLIEK